MQIIPNRHDSGAQLGSFSFLFLEHPASFLTLLTLPHPLELSSNYLFTFLEPPGRLLSPLLLLSNYAKYFYYTEIISLYVSFPPAFLLQRWCLFFFILPTHINNIVFVQRKCSKNSYWIELSSFFILLWVIFYKDIPLSVE